MSVAARRGGAGGGGARHHDGASSDSGGNGHKPGGRGSPGAGKPAASQGERAVPAAGAGAVPCDDVVGPAREFVQPCSVDVGAAALGSRALADTLLFVAARLWPVADVRGHRVCTHLAVCGPEEALNRAVVYNSLALCSTVWMDTVERVGMQRTKYLVITVPLRTVVDVSRMLNLRTLSQYVTVASIQIVYLNPVASGKHHKATGLMFAGTGSGSGPAQCPSLGMEFLLPCRPGTLEPNPTATPFTPKHNEECLKTLRMLRDGGRGASVSTLMYSSPVATPNNAVRRCCRSMWSHVESGKDKGLSSKEVVVEVAKLANPEFARTVETVLAYVVIMSAVHVLPGPSFTGPYRTCEEASAAPPYGKNVDNVKMAVNRAERFRGSGPARKRVAIVEVTLTFPFFSAIALEALGCLLASAKESMVVRVDGMGGTLTVVLSTSFGLTRTRKTKRQRTAKSYERMQK